MRITLPCRILDELWIRETDSLQMEKKAPSKINSFWILGIALLWILVISFKCGDENPAFRLVKLGYI